MGRTENEELRLDCLEKALIAEPMGTSEQIVQTADKFYQFVIQGREANGV